MQDVSLIWLELVNSRFNVGVVQALRPRPGTVFPAGPILSTLLVASIKFEGGEYSWMSQNDNPEE